MVAGRGDTGRENDVVAVVEKAGGRGTEEGELSGEGGGGEGETGRWGKGDTGRREKW